MARYNSGNRKDAIVEERRRKVAKLMVRRLTQRQIEANLPALDCIDTNTGKPWGVMTINRDVKALRKQWREDAAGDTDQHQANILAELAEIKRVAWGAEIPGTKELYPDMTTLLKAINQECKILGLDAPTKYKLEDLTDEQLVRVAAASAGIPESQVRDEWEEEEPTKPTWDLKPSDFLRRSDNGS